MCSPPKRGTSSPEPTLLEAPGLDVVRKTGALTPGALESLSVEVESIEGDGDDGDKESEGFRLDGGMVASFTMSPNEGGDLIAGGRLEDPPPPRGWPSIPLEHF